MFDVAAAEAHLAANDPVMRRLIGDHGPYAPRPAGGEPFFALARAVAFQQLSGRAAETIFRRFVAAAGGDDAARTLDPARVLLLTDEECRAAGLSRQKTATIRALAAAFAEGRLSAEQFAHWPDEEVIAHLTQVRGIGRWTAEMHLMFHLGRPDVLPVNDLGLNRAIRTLYGLERLPTPAEVLRIGQPWRPFASVACWYLWRSEDVRLPGGG